MSLLGHHKRIWASLGKDNRDSLKCQGQHIDKLSDISRIVRIDDIKHGPEDSIYFTHDFSVLQPIKVMQSRCNGCHVLTIFQCLSSCQRPSPGSTASDGEAAVPSSPQSADSQYATVKSATSHKRSQEDGVSLERSDSGCSISSGGPPPELPEKKYSFSEGSQTSKLR